MDEGGIVGALFIDFRKAFDLVIHKILINKLSAYKFSNHSLQWFVSYLNSRQQTIISGSGMSPFATIRCGVPLGSILGSTLFVLFINDLLLLLKCCFSVFYVNDITFHTSSPDINDTDTELQTDFSIGKSWRKRNKITIHCVKTTYILAGARDRLNDN